MFECSSNRDFSLQRVLCRSVIVTYLSLCVSCMLFMAFFLSSRKAFLFVFFSYIGTIIELFQYFRIFFKFLEVSKLFAYKFFIKTLIEKWIFVFKYIKFEMFSNFLQLLYVSQIEMLFKIKYKRQKSFNRKSGLPSPINPSLFRILSILSVLIRSKDISFCIMLISLTAIEH